MSKKFTLLEHVAVVCKMPIICSELNAWKITAIAVFAFDCWMLTLENLYDANIKLQVPETYCKHTN